MEKIGIICEDYKLEKFKEELQAAKIKFNVTRNKKGIVAIVCESEQILVKPVVDKVTKYFNDLKKKLN